MEEFAHCWWKSAWRLLRILSCVTPLQAAPPLPPPLVSCLLSLFAPRQLRLFLLARNRPFPPSLNFFSQPSVLLLGHFPSGFPDFPSLHSSFSKFNFTLLLPLLYLASSFSSHLPIIHSSIHYLFLLLFFPPFCCSCCHPSIIFSQPTLSPPRLLSPPASSHHG